jgi:NIMA (never in mitosis gene a)-related kinase 1/4/5
MKFIKINMLTFILIYIGNGYDMKSDVWSLGCIIYELCEFKSPFRNENEKMSLMDLFTNITKGNN